MIYNMLLNVPLLNSIFELNSINFISLIKRLILLVTTTELVRNSIKTLIHLTVSTAV